MNSEDRNVQQRGVLIYLLCETACRPGCNEKPIRIDGEWTGVGLCTLRKCHIQFFENETVRLQFHGKKHTEFDKKFEFAKRVYDLLLQFYSDCQSDDNFLFNEMSYKELNTYLKNSYNLNSRVFRTNKASGEFETELKRRTADWISRNTNHEDRDTALKNIYQKAREKIQDLLKHKSIEAQKSYVDPRIILAWLVICNQLLICNFKDIR